MDSLVTDINAELWFGVISLFPDMFQALIEHGITGRAIKNGVVGLDVWNPRDFACDRRRTVDERPYGGGPGMVMKIQPLRDAIHTAKTRAGVGAKVIYLSPQGRLLDQAGVKELAASKRLILVAGRYEGIDERLIQYEIDEEWSVGDYVLSGGELPAMLLIDAVSRFVPGTLGNKGSAQEDSFAEGLLDCPHYTRPEVFEGRVVPDVLISGNHRRIKRWRLKESLGRTWLRRPDLLTEREFSGEEEMLLSEFICDYIKSA
ncbi:MAG: tRNA (guanosine(37)-N1)-methyltransferase TrmD [Candidatus Endonucleobacter bathymodioli]|uniref:tRNA (guanine-N(1)-)-methyltransferase n=1 Tax=Candidatus Endonucleibacter bathymodioli TaxID=539814 RepID=A0AA90NLE8_9GAMM|nr:tRNA (guanosine(37)-N1)-methyltransferase TrmD [Candidatus Endonucleobacter bathymodioli]